MSDIYTGDMKEFVVRTNDHKYMVIDECGWPVFDDELCSRTTRRSKGEMEEYIAALKQNGIDYGFVIEAT